MACIEVKVGGLRARRSRPVPGVMARSGVVYRVRTRKSNVPEMPADGWHSDAERQNRWQPVLARGPWKWEEGELLGGG